MGNEVPNLRIGMIKHYLCIGDLLIIVCFLISFNITQHTQIIICILRLAIIYHKYVTGGLF